MNDKGCAFCTVGKCMNEVSRLYSGIEITLIGHGERKNTLRVRAINDDEIPVGQDSVNIAYCPMCGRKIV